MKARSGQLFLRIKKYYKIAVGVSTEIQGWSLEMVKQKDKGPKLRAKGAETRGLVPFGLELACELRDAFSRLVHRDARVLFRISAPTVPRGFS